MAGCYRKILYARDVVLVLGECSLLLLDQVINGGSFMAKPEAVTDSTFEEEVLKSELPVLVDFWADWCQPCKMIAPIVDELSEEYDGRVKFMKVDVDSNPQAPTNLGIRSIPTLIVFKDGQPVEQIVGALPKAQLKRRLDNALESTPNS